MDDKSYGLGDYNTEVNISNNGTEQIPQEELNTYIEERGNADQVAYQTMREDAYKSRVDSVLNSVSSPETSVQEDYNPEYTPERVESLLSSVRDKEPASTKEQNEKTWKDLPVYEIMKSQSTKVSTKEIDPNHIDRLKKIAKGIAIAIVTGAITYGAVKGGISVIKNPDPVMPNQTPQTIELQENIDNAENFNEVIDAINKNKEQNIESGVKSNPEHVIESSSNEEKINEIKENQEQKQEQMTKLREEAIEKKDESSSMQEFVNEVNRQKVIKIESGFQKNPEHVIGDTTETEQGGRSL